MRRCLISPDELEQCASPADNATMATCLPLGISALMSLSSLNLTLGDLSPIVLGTDLVDLGPLHALSLLQDLYVHSDSFGVNLRLSAELGALQNLAFLMLRGPDWDDDQDDRPVVNLDVVWGGMHALQSLTVYHWHFSCTSSILAMTTLMKSILPEAHLLWVLRSQTSNGLPLWCIVWPSDVHISNSSLM